VLLLAHGFWMTNYMALSADLFPASTLASVVGLAGMAGGLAGFLANLAAGHVVEQAGFTPIFLLCGLLYPIGFGVIAMMIPAPADVRGSGG
jgi:ACS family hexuronate transporter-like MFS transporter